MKKQTKKEDESYYGVALFIGILLTVLIHWLLLSGFNMHPTIHAIIGAGIFLTIISAAVPLLKKFW